MLLPTYIIVRQHYQQKLLKSSLKQWEDFWWNGKNEWKLNIRADYHNRYKMLMPLISYYPIFLLFNTGLFVFANCLKMVLVHYVISRNYKYTVCLIKCPQLISLSLSTRFRLWLKVWRGWRSFVLLKRIKKTKINVAEKKGNMLDGSYVLNRQFVLFGTFIMF